MKYIRTYETKEKFLADKDSMSRGFRLKPTLYKYSEVGDHVHLEIDDPRKHGDSTWMRLEFDWDTTFSFKISNVTGDDSNTLSYTIDWGDGTVETNTATRGDDGLYTFTHNYDRDSGLIYDIELYGTDRSYMLVGDSENWGVYFLPIPCVVRRVILGDGVEVGGFAFYCCESLTSINLPSTLTSIGAHAFSTNLFTSINIPESVTSIGRDAFSSCYNLTSINIPDGVTSIGDYMFNGCTSLTSINIPEGVTSIGRGSFGGCTSLTSFNIPEGVTSIGGRMFEGCTSLTSFNIPEGVTSIGENAFNYCTSLTSINLPSTLISIDNLVFNECTSLTSIYSYNTVAPTIGTDVFKYTPSNGTLHIKPGATGYDAWLSKLPSGWVIVEDL